MNALRAPGVGAFAALVVLVAFDASMTPRFLNAATLFQIALQLSTTLLVAEGMTLVVASGGIDLSVGSVMAVASSVAALLLPHGPVAAVAGALVVAFAMGAANGLLVAWLGILPIIVTLATLIIGRGVAQLLASGSALVTFTNPRFEALGKGALGPVPVPVVIAGVVVVVLAVVVRATTFGRYLVALGGNERAAALAGVPIARVKLSAYVASGVLAGIAGLISAARLGAADPGTIGLGNELDAIVATVVGATPLSGGRASIGGTLIGSLLIGVLSASFAIYLLPHALGLVANAAILLGAVVLQRTRSER